jgi:hypothetical protein
MTSAPVSDGLHVFAGALHCGGRARRSRGSTPPERDSVGFPARGTLLYRIELPTVSRLYVSGTPSRAPPSGHGATGEGVAIDAAGDVDREALGSGPEAPIRRALSRPPTSRSVEKATTRSFDRHAGLERRTRLLVDSCDRECLRSPAAYPSPRRQGVARRRGPLGKAGDLQEPGVYSKRGSQAGFSACDVTHRILRRQKPLALQISQNAL